MFERVRDKQFAKRAVKINALVGLDQLFIQLKQAAEQTEYLLVENGMHDWTTESVITCFLDRYKMFLAYAYVVPAEQGEWNFCIKLKCKIAGRSEKGYTALAGSYTQNYYLSDCGGYDEFKRSSGLEISSRLQNVYQLVAPTAGERILDVGCGRGELTFALGATGAQVEGIDYSKDAITIAEGTFGGKRSNVTYTYGDIFAMEAACPFDKVVMADVVEHIEQDVLEKIFEKISKLLDPTGSLVIHTAPNKNFYERTYPKLRELAGRAWCWKPQEPRSYYEQLMHINEQTPQGLEQALKKYFPCVRVWTGDIRHVDIEKTEEQQDGDIEIFAIACRESGGMQAALERLYRLNKQWLPQMHCQKGAERHGNKGILCPPGGIIFGPYVELPAGNHRLVVKLKLPEGVMEIKARVTAQCGKEVVLPLILTNGENLVSINIEQPRQDVELFIENVSQGDLWLNDIFLC